MELGFGISAVVTGGASGLGEATACALAAVMGGAAGVGRAGLGAGGRPVGAVLVQGLEDVGAAGHPIEQRYSGMVRGGESRQAGDEKTLCFHPGLRWCTASA